MRIHTLILSGLLFVPAVAFAQIEAGPQPSATLHVEQISDLDAVGEWTLLYPNHETLRRLDKTLTIPNLVPGKYTFISTPPKGTTALTEFILGDDVIKTENTQQISFELLDTMTAKIRVTYDLTVSGKVGVNSAPSGVPFVLRGPNNMTESGVTPMEFPEMPIGNYSAQFYPKGCPEPPQKSGLLEHNGRVDLMIELHCKTFEAVEEKKEKTLTSDIGAESVTFTDVQSDAWYTPYVATVSSRGLLTGYLDEKGNHTGRFGPGDPVTVAQMAKILHQLMDINEQNVTRAPWNKAAFGQWFTRYFASAEELGWTIYLQPQLDPNRPMTRGEVMETLLQVIDVPVTWAKGKSFSDVKLYTPHASAIETAAAESIVSGSGDDKGLPAFHPVDPVTRAELAKIIITVYEKYIDIEEE